MKLPFLYSAIIILLGSCSNESVKTTENTDNQNEEAIIENSDLCFQRLEGNSNQDTSKLNLTITGTTVNGTLAYLPHEKDSRKGTIKGTRDNNIIKADWIFMQEGMTDTLPLEFRLDGDELLQKTYGFDPSTGRQILTDTSSFSIKYTKVPCENQ